MNEPALLHRVARLAVHRFKNLHFARHSALVGTVQNQQLRTANRGAKNMRQSDRSSESYRERTIMIPDTLGRIREPAVGRRDANQMEKSR